MGWNHFVYCDKRWPLCSLLLFPNWHWVLLPHWRKDYRCEMKQDDFFSLSVLQVFCLLLFQLPIFTPFLHASHHTADLSHLLSLGDLSSPYHSAPALFWFSPRCSFFLITPLFLLLTLLPSTHTSSISSTIFLSATSLLFLLRYFNHSLSLSHLSTLSSMSPPSHSLPSPPVLWKLSPLWGCHAEDLSPSAPAVPPKVT